MVNMTADTKILDQLDALREAATPGPWRWDPEFSDDGDRDSKGLALTNDEAVEIVGAYNWHCCDFRMDPEVSDADAALIAAAVNALPALTTALRAVLALTDELDREDISYSYVTHRIRTALESLETS